MVWLPDSYQANDDRKRAIAENIQPRRAWACRENGFVFCNFNQSYKLTPAIFAGWMRILHAGGGQRAVAAGKPSRRFRSKSAARRRTPWRGARPADLRAHPCRSTEHLARLKLADLFLDTLPYNAHTTASDALWAGLPLLTCRGTTFPGRVAASLLNAIGLPELITEIMERL